MLPSRPPVTCYRPWLMGAVLVLCAAGHAWADKGDRLQPIVVEADKPGVLDLQRQVVVFNGNVKIVQGTMTLQAERIEVREQPGGTRSAVATGTAGQPATYRQKREGLNEVVEGSAHRIEFDARAGTLRFVGQGSVRRIRDGKVADEITGAEIRWDDASEQFSVIGGDAASGGRVRAVLTPLTGTLASPAASAVPGPAPR